MPHLTEATFQIERFAPLLPHCPRDVQVRFLRAAGAIADMAGIPDDAAFVYRERALRLAQQLEDRDLICLCLDAYGSSANRRGAFDRAEPLLRQALALEQARPSDLAKALLSLCHTYRKTGDLTADAACLHEGLQIGQQLNDRFVQILFLTAVADHAEFHKQLTTCVQLYGAFLSLSQKFNIDCLLTTDYCPLAADGDYVIEGNLSRAKDWVHGQRFLIGGTGPSQIAPGDKRMAFVPKCLFHIAPSLCLQRSIGQCNDIIKAADLQIGVIRPELVPQHAGGQTNFASLVKGLGTSLIILLFPGHFAHVGEGCA